MFGTEILDIQHGLIGLAAVFEPLSFRLPHPHSFWSFKVSVNDLIYTPHPVHPRFCSYFDSVMVYSLFFFHVLLPRLAPLLLHLLRCFRRYET